MKKIRTKLECSQFRVMCMTNRNMVPNSRPIGAIIDSSDSDSDEIVQSSPTYCETCGNDPCYFIGFTIEYLDTDQCDRLLRRLTEREARRGSYTGLKNYIIRIHIHRVYRKWANLSEDIRIPSCIRSNLLRLYPLENERQYIYLTSAMHLSMYKARKTDGSLYAGYWWQRQPNNVWLLVDTNGTEIYPENHPDNLVPLIEQTVKMF